MTEYQNNWLIYHRFLSEKESTECRKKVIAVLGCSYTSFFRKLKSPENLSIAEKKAIAEAYLMPLGFLFPEAVPVAL